MMTTTTTTESPRRENKKSYIYPLRRRPSEIDRIRSRKKSVQESIFNFLDDKTNAETFKQGLVQSAKKHQLAVRSAGKQSKLKQLSAEIRKRACEKNNNNSNTVSENDQFRLHEHHPCLDDVADGDDYLTTILGSKTNNSNTTSHTRKSKKNVTKDKKKRTKRSPVEHQFRVKAAQQKLDQSLHDNPCFDQQDDEQAEQAKGDTRERIDRDEGRGKDALQRTGLSSTDNEPVLSCRENLLLNDEQQQKADSFCHSGEEISTKLPVNLETSKIDQKLSPSTENQSLVENESFHSKEETTNNSRKGNESRVIEIRKQLAGASFHKDSDETGKSKHLPVLSNHSMSKREERETTREASIPSMLEGEEEKPSNVPSSELKLSADCPGCKFVEEEKPSSSPMKQKLELSRTNEVSSLDNKIPDMDLSMDDDDATLISTILDVPVSTITIEKDRGSLAENAELQYQQSDMIQKETSSLVDALHAIMLSDRSDKPSSNPSSRGVLPVQTDLKGLLSHLAVLNDLKGLIGAPSCAESKSATESIGDVSRSRFHQMFQAKCSLLNSWDILEEESAAQKQALQEQFDLDEKDLKFILEHILAAKGKCKEIRWDLIEDLIFPEPRDSYFHGSGLGSALEDSASDIFSLVEPKKPSLSMERSVEAGSLYQSLANSALVEEESLNQREQYQEVLLDLIEMEEEMLEQLPPDESYRRQQMLIQLLRATHEEEAYLTPLSLEDVSEIVHHVELCLELDAPIQWSMIENIVFPLGFTLQGDNSDLNYEDSSDGNLGNNYAKDPLHDYFEVTEAELEIVLHHINLCGEIGEDIRWDLVAEILFPCDPTRQEMLSNTALISRSRSSHTKDGPKLSSVVEKRETNMSKERARAVLSLSNHDWEICDSRDVSVDGYDSFCEDFSGNECR